MRHLAILLCALAGGLGCTRGGFEPVAIGTGDAALSADGAVLAGESLDVAFSTTNTVAWSWDAVALGERHVGYELWYGTDRAAVASRAGGSRRWGVEQDPNLGYRVSPLGPQLVHRTAVTGLAPSTRYYGQLWIAEADGSEHLAAEGSATTSPELGRAVTIFDERAPGWALGCREQLASEAHTGQGAMWLRGEQGWLNCTFGDYRADISGMDAVAWEGAFLELYISVEETDSPPPPIAYVEVAMGENHGILQYLYPAYIVIPSGAGWHRVQVALGGMVDDVGARVERDALGDELNWMRIGAAWPADREIYIDDIRIRY